MGRWSGIGGILGARVLVGEWVCVLGTSDWCLCVEVPRGGMACGRWLCGVYYGYCE